MHSKTFARRSNQRDGPKNIKNDALSIVAELAKCDSLLTAGCWFDRFSYQVVISIASRMFMMLQDLKVELDEAPIAEDLNEARDEEESLPINIEQFLAEYTNPLR